MATKETALTIKRNFTRTAPTVADGLKTVQSKEKKMEANVKAGMTVPGWLKDAYKTNGIRYKPLYLKIMEFAS